MLLIPRAYGFSAKKVSNTLFSSGLRSSGDRTPGDRSPAQRSSGATSSASVASNVTPRSSGSGPAGLTPQTLSPAASDSDLSEDDEQDGIMGRRNSQNASLLTFDNPTRASRVVTEASEDRADTVLYTNMMRDIWRNVS